MIHINSADLSKQSSIKFRRMVRLKQACEEAEVDYPQEVKDYFALDKDSRESESCLCIEAEFMSEVDTPNCASSDDKYAGKYSFQLNICDIPREAKAVRFIIYR